MIEETLVRIKIVAINIREIEGRCAAGYLTQADLEICVKHLELCAMALELMVLEIDQMAKPINTY